VSTFAAGQAANGRPFLPDLLEPGMFNADTLTSVDRPEARPSSLFSNRLEINSTLGKGQIGRRLGDGVRRSDFVIEFQLELGYNRHLMGQQVTFG